MIKRLELWRDLHWEELYEKVARRFFDGCLDAANTDRDIDFYHWSSQSFGDFWKDALSVLMARERARIGLAASKGDWPRRIAEYARDDQEDAAAYAANY